MKIDSLDDFMDKNIVEENWTFYDMMKKFKNGQYKFDLPFIPTLGREEMDEVIIKALNSPMIVGGIRKENKVCLFFTVEHSILIHFFAGAYSLKGKKFTDYIWQGILEDKKIKLFITNDESIDIKNYSK